MVSCGGCVSVWGGTAKAHCSGCHETFSGVTTFDAHRRRFACLDPAEIGLIEVEGVWRSPRDNDFRARETA